MDRPAALPPDIWARIPPEAQAYIRTLEGRVETLTTMVHALQKQVDTLQEQLHQTSQNSSRPPSSDPPQTQRLRRPRSKRRRGGQPGHPGHTRILVPVDEVDEVVIIKPKECMHCHASLAGDDPTPWRHQVIEIPPLQPVVTGINGISWRARRVVRPRVRPGRQGSPAAPTAHGCKPQWRCVREPIACPNA